MQQVEVKLGKRAYPILVGPGLLASREAARAARGRGETPGRDRRRGGPAVAAAARGRPRGPRLRGLRAAGRRAAEDARQRRDPHRRAGRCPHQPRWCRARARRRRDRRHLGLCGRVLPARHRDRAAADDAARPGGFVGRRQDRREPPGRQEPDRRLPPAGRGDRGHRHAVDPAGAAIARRVHRDREGGARRGRRVLRLAGGERRARARARARGAGRGDPARLRDQGRDRRRGRARAGAARAPEPRPYLRPRDRGGRGLWRRPARRGGRGRHRARRRAVRAHRAHPGR